MIRYRFLVAACAGTLFYVILSFCCGRDGLWAMEQMQEQKRILSTNTAAIEKTNDELSLEKMSLQKDNDVIAAYARRLGYVSEGEKLVKINGLATIETQIFDAGNVVRHKEANFVPEWFCKGAGLLVCLLLYLVLLLFDYSRGALFTIKHKKSGYNAVKEMPIYDA